MVIFDSNIIVDALRQKRSALDLIEAYSEKEKLAITIINKYEVLRGFMEKDESMVSGLLRQFVIYELTDSAITEAIKAYNKLAEKGKMIGELDMLIAGIVAANNETLVTRDKDFLNLENPKITVA